MFQTLIRRLSTIFLYLFRPLIKRHQWPIILVANAGTTSDIHSYTSGWMGEHLYQNDLYGIGFYRMPSGSLGLVLGTSYSNEQVREDPECIKNIISEVSSWKAKRIGLLGLLPSSAHRHKIWPDHDHRFVRGHFGTVSMIRFNIDSLMHSYPEIKSMPVGVVGSGFTGVAAANGLADKYQIIAVDKDPSLTPAFKQNVTFHGDNYRVLEQCGILILLTISGDGGLETIRDFIKPYHIILVDTHPRPTEHGWGIVASKEAKGYVCGTRLQRGMFIPSLARWDKNNVVGCALEAVVMADQSEPCHSLEEFRDLAWRKGVRSNMERVVDSIT